MASQGEKVETFHRLHAEGCFVMPNPWDVGSAVALERMGFEALATTSAGHAWTLARRDNGVGRDEALEHLRRMVAAIRVPLNADFEGGFADDPKEVASNVTLAVATGIAGLSIEDSTGDADEPLHHSTSPSSGSGRRGRRSTRAARASSSPAAPRDSSSAAPTWRRRSGGCRHTPKRARTACTRRGSRPPRR
jgi:hypothetical protein